MNDNRQTTDVTASTGDFVHGVRLRIFLVSFTLLFFELLCIRWIPAYVRYLSYFTNFILLASFLGNGARDSRRAARFCSAFRRSRSCSSRSRRSWR
jgi:hypothetical protein